MFDDITTEAEAEVAFDDYLNENFPEVKVLGHTFEPARALYTLDSIAYRQAFLDWCDEEGIDLDELE